MADPFLLEQRFRLLQEALSLTSSARMRLMHLVEFVELFRSPEIEPMFGAFAPEVIQELIAAGGSADMRCTPVPLIDRILALFLWCEEHALQLLPEEAWRAVEHSLREQRDTVLRETMSRQKPAAEGALAHWPQGSVWIPLVEQERLRPDSGPVFACLRRLQMEVQVMTGRKAADEFQLHPLHGDGGADFPRILAEARATAARLTGTYPAQRVSITGRLPGVTPVTGHSLEAGMAAAIICALAGPAGSARRYMIRRDAAVTGGIGPGGALLPVDPTGLRTKIEACTWSSVRTLAVPAEQETAARAAAHDIAAAAGMPVLPVTIVAAPSLHRLMQDPRVVTVVRVPLVERILHLPSRHPRLSLALLLAAALVVTGRILWREVDRNPALIAPAGELLLVMNRAGEILDTLDADEAITGALEAHLTVAACADVNGDGINEVLHGASTPGEALSEIVCTPIGGAGPSWRAALGRHLVYPGKPTKSDVFRMRKLAVADADSDGRPELYVIANHDFFPSLVLRFNAATGEETGCYIHAGHLLDVAFADLDGDRRTEIIVCGINNAYTDAALAVLDTMPLRAAGPSTPEYAPADVPPAQERWYIRIPRTVVGLAVPEEQWSRATRVDVLPARRLLQVRIDDQTADPRYRASIEALFDFSLRPVGIDAQSDYDAAALRLFRERRIDSIPDRAYFNRFAASLLYRNGARWETRPTRNGG